MLVEEELGKLLVEQGLTLVTAESCTGGLIAHRITNLSGSSAYYLGGIVAYSNEMKEALLGVRHETLLAHGAVSEETAREMACGARQRLGADVAVSVTGIAGPTGGTPDKPVGLVYVALSAGFPTNARTRQEVPGEERCERYLWQGDRLANKERSAEAALQMVAIYLREWRER
jgi:PncC family amidohydrolase